MLGLKTNESVYTEGMLTAALNQAGIDTNTLAQHASDFENAGDATGKVIALNDIVNNDVMSGVGKKISATDEALRNKAINRRSIIARSSNSIMQFPVYCSSTVRAQEASVVAKAFERVYATLVQTILAQNPIIDENEANDLKFLKQFHTNIMESADMDIYNEFYTPIDDMDAMMTEAVLHTEKLSPTMEVTFRAIPCTDDYLIKESARLCNVPLTGFPYLEDANEQQDKTSETTLQKEVMDETTLKKVADEYGTDLNAFKDAIQKGQHPEFSYDKTEKRYYRIKGKTSKTSIKSTGRPKEAIKAVDAPKLLRDADIKKINGMLPYTIEASFRIKGRNGGTDHDVKYIIGVKTNFHVVEWEDLASDIKDIISGRVKGLQKVRYKTGEITFADYMFNLGGIKKDVSKSINYNKRWLNTLKRLSEWQDTNRSLLSSPAKLIAKGDIPIPNGTLILTASDVANVLGTSGIDLTYVPTAKRLARALFLIGICIIDGAAGTMNVLFPDTDNSWDVQSLASIDAEVSKSDNSALMKELNRAINH